MSTLQPRSHAERLRYNLNEVRAELVQTVQSLSPDELNLAPNFEKKMKTFKQILQEIGTMEALCYNIVAKASAERVVEAEYADWDAEWNTLDKNNAGDMLSALAAIRANTLGYLNACSEAELQAPIPLPESWYQYFDGRHHIEPEELFQWVLRHEYYHLGQLITYQWLRGHAPE